ncbi:MAG: hypothetical protein AAGJ91_07590 [Pseudomonadota bacterium]
MPTDETSEYESHPITVPPNSTVEVFLVEEDGTRSLQSVLGRGWRLARRPNETKEDFTRRAEILTPYLSLEDG